VRAGVDKPTMQGKLFSQDFLRQGIKETNAWKRLDAHAFQAKVTELARLRSPKPDRLRALQALDPAEQILDLKVCDPAMGSGHFLVSLVDYLADQVLEQAMIIVSARRNLDCASQAPLHPGYADYGPNDDHGRWNR